MTGLQHWNDRGTAFCSESFGIPMKEAQARYQIFFGRMDGYVFMKPKSTINWDW